MPKKKKGGGAGGKKKGNKNKAPMTNKEMKQIKKMAEDKTFGMKNKNKSKKVQKAIKNMTQGKGGMDKFISDQYKAKKAKKAAMKDARFMAAVYASRKLTKKNEEQFQEEEPEEEVPLTWEEQLEKDLLEIRTSGKKLTAITLENFLEWKDRRLKRKEAEKFERTKEELKKAGHKRNLKGLMTGLSLFKKNGKDAFKDADDAGDIEREVEVDDPTMKVHNINDYQLRMPTLKKADHEMEEKKDEAVEIDEGAFGDEDLDDDEDFED